MIQTIIPDYLNGDPIPPDALKPGSGFDIGTWFPNHTEEKTRPTLNKVLEALKKDGVIKLAATGYCFGGKFWFRFTDDEGAHMTRSLCI